MYLESGMAGLGTVFKECGEVGLRAEQKAPSLLDWENRCGTHGDAGFMRGVGRNVGFHFLTC